MAINFNAQPYYDDFNDTKNYHRILFKPGYAVQARELTQLQTQVQDQIKKFGNHIFKNGSVVLDGERFFEKDLTHIKIGNSLFGNQVTQANLIGLTITGSTSGTKAIIKGITTVEGAGYVLIVKLTSGSAFTLGESLTTTIGTASTITNSVGSIGKAMMFSAGVGIYYINGKFVYTAEQNVIVDPVSNTSSKNIGFLVTETVVSAEDDETLLDNAQGTPNYAAPGSDRYSVELVLSVKNFADNIENFSEIARVENGEMVSNFDKTIYSEIGNELASRTFDESGDYTVKTWKIQLEEDTANNAKFSVALEPGKGYIKGYEFETENQTFLSFDKGRDFDSVVSSNTTISYGNFVHVSDMSGVFNVGTLETVNLKDAVGANIGTAKIRYLQHLTGNISDKTGTTRAIYRMYLFNIIMDSGKTFQEVESIASVANSGVTAIDDLSKLDGSGDTFLSGTDSPSLVFQSINKFIDDVSNINYRYQKVYTDIAFTSGIGTITAGPTETFVGGEDGTLNDTNIDLHYHVVVTSVPVGSPYTVGQVLDFSDGTAGKTVSVSGTPQIATFNVNASVAFSATIIATLDNNNQTVRTKTLSGYTKGVISSTLNTVLGDIDSLGVADIENIYSVYNIGNNTDVSTVDIDADGKVSSWGDVTPINTTDIKDNYVLDNGQRAEFYDHGGLVLVGTAPSNTAHNLLVVYKNFTHSSSGFTLTRESYVNVDYADIPTFTDPSTGKTYELRDCFDFRPRRENNLTSFTSTHIPTPNSTLESNYKYYLGRMDRIIAMADKSFIIKRGVPALSPVLPVNDTNGMVIYEVIVPPYTASVEDVAIKYVDNKRYTMRDIGKLDKRIQNLEYYTQLSLLEKQAKDTSIPDATTFEKFKNGIAVDSFSSQDVFVLSSANWANRRWGWWNAWFNGSNTWNSFGAQNYNENSIAEVANLDFSVAIDPANQEMRAPFTLEYSDFDIKSYTNTEKPGALVTLNFEEKVFIDQPYKTTIININPFDVIKFIGKLDLEPPFDNWIETNLLPAVNKIVDVRVPDAADRIVNNISGGGNTVRITNTSTSIVTNTIGSTTQSLGAAVVDVQFVPFIRANTVIGTGKLFKPKARLYPFVENTPVSEYCKPLTILTVEHVSNSLFDDTQGVYETLTFTGGATAKTALYSPPTSANPDLRLLSVFDITGDISIGNTITGAKGGTATVIAIDTYNLEDPIVPDEYGYIAFQFDIPPGVFRTGERTVRLIDNSTNDLSLQESFGEAKYNANGIIQSKQETILTTRTLQRQRVTTQTGFRFQSDPLAQTFFIDEIANPEGIFVSSVDVYFRTQSQTIPVTMQIRRTVNGYPESFPSIPFSETVLNPEFVSVSTDGSVATKFTFKSPVHLVPGEYAIVLIANTSEYNVFVAETGQTVIGGAKIVDKQPSTGVLFMSQNARTWTADQNKDLAFKINRAEFVSEGAVEFTVRNPAELKQYQNLFINASVIAPSTTRIAWSIKTTSAGGALDSQYTAFNVNQDVEFGALKQLSTTGDTLIIRGQLYTDNVKVSPAIDNSSVSAITILNDINNEITGEDGKRGGGALARYITKPIVLADGFDASNLCVSVDVNRPAGTNIQVYYKVLSTEKTTPISEESWVLMQLENTTSISATNYDYKEHRFFPVNSFDEFGVPADSPIPIRFNTFQVKIVLTSTSKTVTPKCRDLRIIALDA